VTVGYQVEASRFRQGQWWALLNRTVETRTWLHAWALRRLLPTTDDVRWRIRRVYAMGGRR
jgi:hypothetical protein